MTNYTVVFEREKDGGFVVCVPALPGCVSQGDTHDEAVAHIRDAITCYLAALAKFGRSAPQHTPHAWEAT